MEINGSYRKPQWMDMWKIFLLFSVIVYFIAFGLRLIDLPKWSNPLCTFDGEYIMGTHDAYYWLAGARGVGSAVNHPMASLLRFLGSLTGITYGNLAFWLPAFMAGLTAIAAFLWGMLVGGRWVGLAGAVFATSIPSFYFRTRLSYYDTDLVTLFFPLITSGLLAGWVLQGLRSSWLPSKSEDKVDFEPTVYDYFLPYLSGILVLYGGTWHTDVRMFGFVVAVIGTFLSFFCADSSKNRATLFKGLFIFAVSAFWGLGGVAVGLMLVFVFCDARFREHKILNNFWIYLVLLVVAIALSGAGSMAISDVFSKVLNYMKPVSEYGAEPSHTPIYPGVTQSIIEVQNISYGALFMNVIGSKFLGWAGFLFFFGLILIRPISIMVLPLAFAGIAAVYIGGRFGMFCGLPLGIGVGGFGNFIFQRFLKNKNDFKKLSWLVPCCFSLMLVGTNSKLYSNMQVTPIMYPEHVKALIEAGKEMPEGSTVWTWWDWGYASMYYTGRNSFANGGNHAGQLLYPLAFAYSTPSLKQSSQFMKYCALNSDSPSTVWDKMRASDVSALIKSFGSKNYNFPVKNKQYLVITWKDVNLAYWILYYGSWNVATGMGVHPSTSLVNSAFSLDVNQGFMLIKGEQSKIPLSTVRILGKNEITVKGFDHPKAPALLYNKVLRQGFMLDEFSNSSMLVRLLSEDPESPAISRHFKLVYEGSPFVRVYEVL